MQKPNHSPPATTTLPTRNLPARLTVPPLPPQIHRRLVISTTPEGLLLRPSHPNGTPIDGEEAALVRWGVRGKIEACEGARVGHDAEHAVELGGVLGIVRLWDAAHLIVFLPSHKPPAKLFPNDDPFGPQQEYGTHEVFTLGDVHAVPLVPERAKAHLVKLGSMMSKRTPKKPKKPLATGRSQGTPTKAGLGLRWNLPLPWSTPATPLDTPADSEESESESESDESSDESDFEAELRRRRSSSIAPEADETPCDLPPNVDESPEARVRKRFSLGWGRFTPRLGKPRIVLNAVAALTPKGKTTSEETPAPSEGRASSEEPRVSFEVAPVEPVVQLSPVKAESGHNVPLADAPAPAPAEPTSPSMEPTPMAPPNDPPAPLPPMDAPQRRELETKILKQITRELASGEFFYSFDFDLSHSLQYKRNRLASRNASQPLLDQLLARRATVSQPFFPESPNSQQKSPVLGSDISDSGSVKSSKSFRPESEIIEPDIHVPLWRRFDRRFFWNEWLAHDFIEVGLHSFVLPVLQGWMQAATFTVPMPPSYADEVPPPIPVDMVLISRRSRERAGLRYQRRGIDDEGHVANFVETEMMVRVRTPAGDPSLFSFVQIRGSIPLKWSQTPWSMKPPPVLDQPIDQTYSVANLHFDDLRPRYGPVTIINLSEQHGKEAIVTNGYGELVKSLERPDIKYIPWDFHAKCSGMKWENISDLISELAPDFEGMGYLWNLKGEVVQEQKGVFRTNCIDCLDRTNVVQSAVARHVLNQMLKQLGLVLDPATSNVEAVFSDVWANNGDMISLCYAHTSALKGDFVRTGKRDLSGMLHDGVSSLSRMFYGAVSDFFAQAVISFMLGHRNLGVFNEFLENLQSTERSALIKQSRVRAAAVETSSARVLSEGEHRIAGWTLLSPAERNTKLSPKLEEKVLLLTKVAIYVVSFNYSLEKVVEFTRIPLKSITSIEKGAYILSALQEAGRDPVENAGFVLTFSPVDESTRYSTYSVRNEEEPTPARKRRSSTRRKTITGDDTPAALRATPVGVDTPPPALRHAEADGTAQFFAFKALPREFARASRNPASDDDGSDDEDDIGLESNESCRATVERIVRRVKEQSVRAGAAVKVEDRDVVSLADAQSATSIMARMDYAVKRFLWL